MSQAVVQQGHPTYISTATTTLVETGPGVLHTITIGGGTLGTIAIYDGLTAGGTLIASFDATTPRGSYTLDINFSVGLTIVTGAATLLTISTTQ